MPSPKDILVITTSSTEGLPIVKYLKPVAAHIVAGTNLFNDLFADITDVFGGRSQTYQKQLSSLYAEAIEHIKLSAHELGGNCVLGLKIDIDEIAGKGKAMFMITAIGTAAIIEGLSNKPNISSSNKLENVSVDRINTLRSKREILKRMESGTLKLTDEVWDFITFNQIDEVFPFLIKEFSQRFPPDETNSEHVDKYYKRLKNYLDSLPEEKKINLLYEYVANEKNEKLANKLAQIIRELYLLNLERTITLLQSTDFQVQKRAVTISTFDKPFYNKQDINQFKQLHHLLSNSFKDKGTRTTKKQLLSSKDREVWNCECGKVNEIDSYCVGCHKDIQGFNEKEIKPIAAANFIEQKIELITDSVE
jgi:Uncharacterized conserved protein